MSVDDFLVCVSFYTHLNYLTCPCTPAPSAEKEHSSLVVRRGGESSAPRSAVTRFTRPERGYVEYSKSCPK